MQKAVPQSLQGEHCGLHRGPKAIEIMKTSEHKNKYQLKMYKEAKPLSHLGEYAVLTQETKEFGGILDLTGNTE